MDPIVRGPVLSVDSVEAIDSVSDSESGVEFDFGYGDRLFVSGVSVADLSDRIDVADDIFVF